MAVAMERPHQRLVAQFPCLRPQLTTLDDRRELAPDVVPCPDPIPKGIQQGRDRCKRILSPRFNRVLAAGFESAKGHLQLPAFYHIRYHQDKAVATECQKHRCLAENPPHLRRQLVDPVGPRVVQEFSGISS